MRSIAIATLCLLMAGCAGGQTPEPETPTPEEEPPPPVPLGVLPLAGQIVIVLPNSYVFAPDDMAPFGSRPATLAWTDSLLGQFLEANAPEVNWMLPPELRRVAGRAPGMAADPDKLGQAVLRNERLTVVPDPLRSSLRTLAAIAGARYALVPAMVVFTRGDSTVDVRVNAVLVDVRTGGMPWRQVGRGSGGFPDEAFDAALLTLLPREEIEP